MFTHFFNSTPVSVFQLTDSGMLGLRGVGVLSLVTVVGSGGYAFARGWRSRGSHAKAVGRRSADAASSVAQVTLRIIEPHESIMSEWAERGE